MIQDIIFGILMFFVLLTLKNISHELIKLLLGGKNDK